MHQQLEFATTQQLAAATTGAPVTTAAVAAAGSGGGAVAAKYGDPKCPCIGFDGLEGEVSVAIDGKNVQYPADLAASCSAWDDGRHPLCLDGQKPGKGNGWCAQSWCYVDICECDLPVLPKTSGYLPHATYMAKPLYFSYMTCGGTNTYSEKTPEIGVPECRCVGFEHREGTIPVAIGDGKIDYPAEIGGSCQAWDQDRHPSCRGDKAPEWCHQTWCFVNPCECGLEVPPKVSGYLPKVTFRGRPLYFSYAACGNKDSYTESEYKDACVNQKSEADCTGKEKCGWTGSVCKGKDLIEACAAPVGHEGGASHPQAGGDHSGTCATTAPAAAALGTLMLAVAAGV